MPAKSQKQQQFMGMVLKCKRDGDCPSDAVKKAASSMSEDEIKKFAGTEHEGLPKKVAENLSFKDFLMIEEMEEEK
jgi:hypothetical protein